MSSAPQIERLPSMSDQAHAVSGAIDRAQALLIRTWSVLKWITQHVRVQPARKNLRVCESVSLGEKRFVAVVQVDNERFLIGGSSGSLSLLSRLQETKSFAEVLDREAGKIS